MGKLSPGCPHGYNMRRIVIFCFALVAYGCAAKAPACDVDAGPRVYEAGGIGQQWIDYVWIELAPESQTTGADAGTTGHPAADAVSGRLFVLSADPVGAVVPTMIDLSCATSPVEYAPASVPVMFDAGRFKTSYTWGNCAACSECYMRWTFSLDVDAQLQDGALVADLVLNETFHDQPMKITSVRMQDVTAACTEPRLRCEADGDCGPLRFAERE